MSIFLPDSSSSHTTPQRAPLYFRRFFSLISQDAINAVLGAGHRLEQGSLPRDTSYLYRKTTPLAASPQGFVNCAVGFVLFGAGDLTWSSAC